MTLAITYSRAQMGINAPCVTVESHLSNGLPSLTLVGLPETAVREAKDRVRSAIINSQFDFPARRITLNLAPADLPKEGGRFDLAIALGILASSGQIPSEPLKEIECLGELALSGHIRPVRGVLAAAVAARETERALFVPKENAEEASLARGLTVYAVEHLLEVAAHFTGQKILEPFHSKGLQKKMDHYHDLADIQGQVAAKRALLIAASGAHNLLFTGPPGTGKTLLATRLPGILPELTEQEALEVAAIYSIIEIKPLTYWPQRPFRSPHHTSSAAALVGGGSKPLPGEVTLAHQGVLFLDEFTEFDRKVLEVLREPLENHEIMVARAKEKALFPAKFQLVAAMNPCPCGYLGDPAKNCRCTPEQIQRYRSKLSGPLLDRIDLHVTVAKEALTLSNSQAEPLTSKEATKQVAEARAIQLQRQGCPNAYLDIKTLQQVCQLTADDQQWFEQAGEKLGLSLRALHRCLKVARTIADMQKEVSVRRSHLAEVLHYRPMGL